jgi:hypothetical protein
VKCPHCAQNLPSKRALSSFFKPTHCESCEQNFVVTLSVKRGALLILPVAATLFFVKPLAYQWQIDATFLHAIILCLYGLSCLTVRSA